MTGMQQDCNRLADDLHCMLTYDRNGSYCPQHFVYGTNEKVSVGDITSRSLRAYFYHKLSLNDRDVTGLQ